MESFTFENLRILTRWMADNDYSGADIADAVEKPWKYDDELRSARRALATAAGDQ